MSASSIPSSTANSIQATNMANAFASLGHEVTLFGRYRRDESFNLDLSIKDFYGVKSRFDIKIARWDRGSLLFATWYVWRTALGVLKFRPHLVVSRHILVSIVLGTLGVRVLHESHAPEMNSTKTGIYLTRVLLKTRSLIGIVVITRALESYYKKNFRISTKVVFCLPDGANTTPKREPDKTGRKFRVGYFGSLYRGRGVDLILEVAASLPEIQFYVYGDVKFSDLEVLERGRLLKNVTFAGFLLPSEAQARQSQFDVLLAPYQKMTFDRVGNDTTQWMSPLKIFEYMASGVPLIASDLASLREVLVSFRNCILVESESVGEWRDAITLLQENESLGRVLADKAWSEFYQSYTWDRRARKIIETVAQSA